MREIDGLPAEWRARSAAIAQYVKASDLPSRMYLAAVDDCAAELEGILEDNPARPRWAMWLLLATSLLVFAAPARANDTNAWRASLTSAITAHAFDLASTIDCQARGVCVEANPLLARANGPIKFTAVKMPLASLSLWGCAVLRDHGQRALAYTCVLGQTVGFSLVAAHNRRVTR